MAEHEQAEELELARALGRAIVARRGELGLKRNDLRDRCGLSYPYIAELEAGTKRPSSRALTALAEALELRPSELLERAELLRQTTEATATAAFLAPPAPMAAGAVREQRGRWFGGRAPDELDAPAAERPPVQSGARLRRMAEPRLTEDRVREIVREVVREELRNAGIDVEASDSRSPKKRRGKGRT